MKPNDYPYQYLGRRGTRQLMNSLSQRLTVDRWIDTRAGRMASASRSRNAFNRVKLYHDANKKQVSA